MRNYVQRGENLTVAAPYAVLSGAGVKLGAIFGVAAEDADQGATVDLATCGVFSLPKVAALAVAVGDLVFWTIPPSRSRRRRAATPESGWP